MTAVNLLHSIFNICNSNSILPLLQGKFITVYPLLALMKKGKRLKDHLC